MSKFVAAAVLALVTVVTTVVTAEEPAVPDTWCEVVDDNQEGLPEIPPDAEQTERGRCSQTAKKYRISDTSNQVCYIRTCCRRVYRDGQWQMICSDSYVKCETVIVN
jgi:hypothetical protein